MIRSLDLYFFFLLGYGGPSTLVLWSLLGLLYQSWMTGESIWSVSEMMIDKESKLLGVKPVLLSLCPSLIPHAFIWV
jgi:hypothetical protein